MQKASATSGDDVMAELRLLHRVNCEVRRAPSGGRAAPVINGHENPRVVHAPCL
jgi:hypothetical protein